MEAISMEGLVITQPLHRKRDLELIIVLWSSLFYFFIYIANNIIVHIIARYAQNKMMLITQVEWQ